MYKCIAWKQFRNVYLHVGIITACKSPQKDSDEKQENSSL